MQVYSFINSYDPFQWDKNPSSISKSRIFEYTDDHVIAAFADEKRRIKNEIKEYPALLSVESPSDISARVGWITDIDWSNEDPTIHFRFDETYRPISQSELAEIQWELGISEFEFYRTHWAIKQVDLLKVLANRGFMIPVFDDPFEEGQNAALTFEKVVVAPKLLPSVFVSYSHADSMHLKRLQVHLAPLKKWTTVQTWDDTLLSAGDNWREKIEVAMNNCSAAVLLVSADFMASDFISNNELPPLLKKAEVNGTRIIPIILKPCLYTSHPELKNFQALNSPDHSLISLDEAGQEALWSKLAKTVYDMVEQ